MENINASPSGRPPLPVSQSSPELKKSDKRKSVDLMSLFKHHDKAVGGSPGGSSGSSGGSSASPTKPDSKKEKEEKKKRLKEDKQREKEVERQREEEKVRLKKLEKEEKQRQKQKIKDLEKQLEIEKHKLKKQQRESGTFSAENAVVPSLRPTLSTVPSSSSLVNESTSNTLTSIGDTHSVISENDDLSSISTSLQNNNNNYSSSYSVSSTVSLPAYSDLSRHAEKQEKLDKHREKEREKEEKRKHRSSITEFFSKVLTHSHSHSDIQYNQTQNPTAPVPSTALKPVGFPLGQHRSSLDVLKETKKHSGSTLSENDLTDDSDSMSNNTTNTHTFVENHPPSPPPTQSQVYSSSLPNPTNPHLSPRSRDDWNDTSSNYSGSTNNTTQTTITNDHISEATLMKSASFKRNLEFFYEKIFAAEASGSRYNPLDDKRKTTENKTNLGQFLKNKKGPFGIDNKNLQHLITGEPTSKTGNHQRSFSTSTVPPDLKNIMMENVNSSQSATNSPHIRYENANLKRKGNLFKRTLNPNRLSLTLGRNLDREARQQQQQQTGLNSSTSNRPKPFDKLLQFDGAGRLKKLQSSVKGFLNVDIPSYGKKKKDIPTPKQKAINDLMSDLEEEHNSRLLSSSLGSSTSSIMPIIKGPSHPSVSKQYIQQLQLQKRTIYLRDLKSMVSRLEMNVEIHSNKLEDFKSSQDCLSREMKKISDELKECSDLSKQHIYASKANQMEIQLRMERTRPHLDESVDIKKFFDKSKEIEDRVQILRRKTFEKKSNHSLFYKIFLVAYLVIVFKFIMKGCEQLFQKLDSVNNNLNNQKLSNQNFQTQSINLLNNQNTNTSRNNSNNDLSNLLPNQSNSNNNSNNNLSNLVNQNNLIVNDGLPNVNSNQDQNELMKTAKSNLDKLTKTINLMREIDGQSNTINDDDLDDEIDE